MTLFTKWNFIGHGGTNRYFRATLDGIEWDICVGESEGQTVAILHREEELIETFVGWNAQSEAESYAENYKESTT